MRDRKKKKGDQRSPVTSLHDVAAMLRVTRPKGTPIDPGHAAGRRAMVAEMCRFIGDQVGVGKAVAAKRINAGNTEAAPAPNDPLSPRLKQTLDRLLDGDSEKQVAYKLKLSQHTVHVYVKSLYRTFNVSSRAELMLKHLKRKS